MRRRGEEDGRKEAQKAQRKNREWTRMNTKGARVCIRGPGERWDEY